MKKLSREDYNKLKRDIVIDFELDNVPSYKKQKRSKKRNNWLKVYANYYGYHINTIARAVKSKSYADYLRKGNARKTPRETMTRTSGLLVAKKWNEVYGLPDAPEINEPKPKKYKVTVITNKVYHVETKGAVLISDIPGEDTSKMMFRRVVDSAIATIADDIAKDLVKDFRKVFVKEVNAEVRKHLTENKEKIISKMVKIAKKEAENKLEEVYDDY